MKKRLLIILAVMFMTSCGGGGGPQAVKLDAAIDWPPVMTGLSTNLYKATAELSEDDGIVVSDIIGEYANNRYLFDLGDIDGGDYTIRLDISFVSVSGEIGVATIAKEVELTKGVQSIVFQASDFTDIGGGDEDGDLLDNLTELRLGLDPLLADTDGDQVPDASDLFPSAASEWLDTDGDGTGDNSDEDIDGDGLTNDEELELGTAAANADTDGDGVGDRSDNCRLGPNPDQADRDGDLAGNACDSDQDGDGLSDDDEEGLGTDSTRTDTDGDGISDNSEVAGGLNPLSADTDGDRAGDRDDRFPLDAGEWADSDSDGVGDNADNCRGVPNREQTNTDSELALAGYPVDADVMGDVCDDDIDGDGLNVVFVDAGRGSDENIGIFRAPVETIGRGLLLAYQRSEDIYVAGGSYDLDGVMFRNGVSLFGGYDGSTFELLINERDIRSDEGEFCTYLENSGGAVTLSIDQPAGTFAVEGFHIRNGADAERSTAVRLSNSNAVIRGNTIFGNDGAAFSTGVEINGGSPRIAANWIDGGGASDATQSRGLYAESAAPVVVNNIIAGGRGRHSGGAELKLSDAVIVNNTIDGTSHAEVPGTSGGLIFDESDPVVVNNVIVAGAGGESGDAVGMKCFGSPPEDGEFRNNIFSTFAARTSDAAVVDCNGQFHYSASFSMGAAAVSGNTVYEGGFGGLLDGSYGLSGTVGMNQGLNTNLSLYGSVVTDFDGVNRVPGSYDIGAKER